MSVRIEHKVSDKYGRHKENDLSNVSSKHNAGVRTVIVTPFDGWGDFQDKALAFFMTTETRDEAIRHLWELKQGKRPVEDYIINFKSWAQLTNFNEIALIAQFKGGLNAPLGMKIVENRAPGDGLMAGDLQLWYDRAMALDKAWRDGQKLYGAAM